MNLWGVLLLSGLVTYAIRLSFILLWGRLRIPDIVQRGLNYVPPAVLSAIIFPELFIRDGQIELTSLNPRLYAGIIAIVVAWKTRSALVTILAGMAALFIIETLIRYL